MIVVDETGIHREERGLTLTCELRQLYLVQLSFRGIARERLKQKFKKCSYFVEHTDALPIVHIVKTSTRPIMKASKWIMPGMKETGRQSSLRIFNLLRKYLLLFRLLDGFT